MGRAIVEMGSLGTQANDDKAQEVRRLESAARDVIRALHRWERVRQTESRRRALLNLARAVRRLGLGLLGEKASVTAVREFSYAVSLLLLKRAMASLPENREKEHDHE